MSDEADTLPPPASMPEGVTMEYLAERLGIIDRKQEYMSADLTAMFAFVREKLRGLGELEERVERLERYKRDSRNGVHG